MVRIPASGQYLASGRRKLHGAKLDHPHHGADLSSSRTEIGHRPGAFWHRYRRQYGGRPVPPAGWPQSLRRVNDRRHAYYGFGRGRVAMAANNAILLGHRDLLAGVDSFLAAVAAYDVTKRRAQRKALRFPAHGLMNFRKPTLR